MKWKHRALVVLFSASITLAAAICVARFDSPIWEAPTRPSAYRLASFPRIMLWAWERPENLSFIDPREVGVAFLASTVYLRSETVVVRPRLQPLTVPNGATLMAVVRIESDRFSPPVLSPDQRAKMVSAITALADRPSVAAIQVDFDATASERAFYRDVLSDLRRALPDSMPLSITALASWCLHDTWLQTAPVDEAVPMLFRMGPDHPQVRLHIQGGGDFPPALCRQSLGISTDELMPRWPSGRRMYIFHPQAWSKEDVQKIREEVKPWQ